jgi:hypothetical protein
MKRLDSLLIILLAVIFIVYALSERAGLSATTVSVPQQEITAKLNELDNRVAALQTNLDWSNALLKQRGLRQ